MANVTTIYACTQSGLYIFNKPGTLPEWLPAKHVLEGRSVLSAWAEPGPPIRVLAVALLGGHVEESAGGELLLSENGGRTWEPALDAPVTAVVGIASEDGEPERLYAGMSGGGLAGSIDGGVTWGILPPLADGGTVRLLAADAKQPGRLYALLDSEGATSLLEGSAEDGEWHQLAADGAAAFAQDTATGDLYIVTGDGVQVSTDGGIMFAPLPGSPQDGAALTVIPGPVDMPPTVLVGSGSSLFASSDSGATWQEVALPQPGGITAFARDPERRDRLYAVTSTGHILESGNRGQSWQPVSSAPLPPVRYLYVIRI